MLRRAPFGGNLAVKDYLETIIRAKEISNWTTYTRKGQESRGRSWPLTELALDRLAAYRMVEDGVFSYRDLGFPTVEGSIPYWIVREHMQIRNMRGAARAEKARQDKL